MAINKIIGLTFQNLQCISSYMFNGVIRCSICGCSLEREVSDLTNLSLAKVWVGSAGGTTLTKEDFILSE